MMYGNEDENSEGLVAEPAKANSGSTRRSIFWGHRASRIVLARSTLELGLPN